MFSPYHTSGFYCASVTKALLSFLVLSSVAINVPLSAYRHWFHITYETIFEESQWDKYLASRCVFLDPKDILCACILLYHFRIFERRYGSTKFTSCLLATFTLSLIIELVSLYALHLVDVHVTAIPTGPWGTVFALFVPYFCDVPRVAVTHIWGVPFTGKSVTYIIGLQMFSSSLECLLLAACGLFAGLLYKNNVILLQSWFRIPRSVGVLVGKTLGRVFYTPCPRDLNTPIGATLELQRLQYMEQLEQQMISSRLPRQRNRVNGPFSLFRRQNQHDDENNAVLSEDHIQHLVEMGFDRQRVVDALQRANNDTTTATSILLNQ